MIEAPEQFITALNAAVPCGPNLEYDARMMELEEEFAGKPEQQMGDSIIPATPPNWKFVEKNAAELMTKTRDLRIVIYWTVARLAKAGISGFREGLAVIQALSEHFWNELWPIPDDGDVQERLSALLTLSPQPGGFSSDMTVIQLLNDMPLCSSPRVGEYSLRDIRDAQERGDDDATKLIKAALLDTDPAWIEETRSHVEAVIQCLKDIKDCYYEHGQGTPDFRMTGDLLKEMLLFFDTRPVAAPAPETPQPPEQPTPAVAPAAADAPAAPQTPPVGTQAPMPANANTLTGRNDAIRIMEQLCIWFEENEPSSPVPYFLKRAIRAVGANFMDILADIAPNMQDQAKLILKPDASAPQARHIATPQNSDIPAPRPQQTPTPTTEPQPPVEYANPFA